MKYVTVKEYARRHGITVQAVYKMIKEGRIKYKMVLDRYLVAP